MNKIFVHPKIQRPKPCLLMFASLVGLDGFHLLLSTQLTADLTLEWNGGSLFHPLSNIYIKIPFCCIETVTNYALNRQHIVFDWLWANATPSLNSAFSLTNVNAKWWIHCLLISSTTLLSHATSIYNWSKWVCEVFLVFSGTTADFGWLVHSASFLSVQLHLKSALPPPNHCFWLSRGRITLIKPLFCLNSNFFHWKTMLYQHTKFKFFHCFENLQK